MYLNSKKNKQRIFAQCLQLTSYEKSTDKTDAQNKHDTTESIQTGVLKIDNAAVLTVKAASGVQLQLTTSYAEWQSLAPRLLHTAAAVLIHHRGAAAVAA